MHGDNDLTKDFFKPFENKSKNFIANTLREKVDSLSMRPVLRTDSSKFLHISSQKLTQQQWQDLASFICQNNLPQY